jgi:hypothetical protein
MPRTNKVINHRDYSNAPTTSHVSVLSCKMILINNEEDPMPAFM